MDTNGEILLVENQGTLFVIDVRDKTDPVVQAELTGADVHTITCVLDCTYAYGENGKIFDLRDPSAPKLLAKDWTDLLPDIESFHDVTEVAPGMILTASQPISLIDARSTRRTRSWPSARRWRPIGSCTRPAGHAGATDDFLLIGGEAIGPQCVGSDSATFSTWNATTFTADRRVPRADRPPRRGPGARLQLLHPLVPGAPQLRQRRADGDLLVRARHEVPAGQLRAARSPRTATTCPPAARRRPPTGSPTAWCTWRTTCAGSTCCASRATSAAPSPVPPRIRRPPAARPAAAAKKADPRRDLSRYLSVASNRSCVGRRGLRISLRAKRPGARQAAGRVRERSPGRAPERTQAEAAQLRAAPQAESDDRPRGGEDTDRAGGRHPQGLPPLRRAPVEGAAGRRSGPGLASGHDLRSAVLPALTPRQRRPDRRMLRSRAARRRGRGQRPAAPRPAEPQPRRVRRRPRDVDRQGRDRRDHRHRREAPRTPTSRAADCCRATTSWTTTATPQDDVDGHGTHVLGIVGAAENNGVGVSSVAPGARLLPVRVLDNTGSGFISDVAKGIDYAVAQGAHVINLSLGSDIPLLGALGGDEYDDAIRRALAAGRVVVASSGNNGTAGLRAAVGRRWPAVRRGRERQRHEDVVLQLRRRARPHGAGQQRALHLRGQRLHADLGHVAGGAPRVGRGRAARGEGPARPGRGEPHPRHGARRRARPVPTPCTARAS